MPMERLMLLLPNPLLPPLLTLRFLQPLTHVIRRSMKRRSRRPQNR
jgi:hypothetical protein